VKLVSDDLPVFHWRYDAELANPVQQPQTIIEIRPYRGGEFEPRRLRSRVARAERDFATLSPASKRSAQEVTFANMASARLANFPNPKPDSLAEWKS